MSPDGSAKSASNAPPRYDVPLVAGPMLAANRSPATAGPEPAGKPARWNGNAPLTALRGGIFWGVLVLVPVVGVLLYLLARLLSAASPP